MLQTVRKGFTLIELLVVITIIGILATGAVTTFTSQIQKARDTTRINDVKALESSIQQFYQDTSVYPTGGRDFTGNGTNSVTVTTYLPTLAQDPKHNQTCDGSRCGYTYRVGADTVGIVAGAFEVSTAFENAANKASRANNTSDNGNDTERLEIHVGNTLDTSHAQATAFNGTVLGVADTSAQLVVVNSAVHQK